METEPEKQLISILQLVPDPNVSLIRDCNLTMSPVSKLSIRNNSMEFLENYNLTPSLKNEIPKSLRSTRKRIGNALSSLQNNSISEGFLYSDQNDTLNESIANVTRSEVEAQEEEHEEEAQIMSLDDQPKGEQFNPEVKVCLLLVLYEIVQHYSSCRNSRRP